MAWVTVSLVSSSAVTRVLVTRAAWFAMVVCLERKRRFWFIIIG